MCASNCWYNIKVLDKFLEGLNPEQKRAVETTEGPLLILAGAGSGKTKTLTHRIAYLIAAGMASPYNILAVTFTNKAANEMRQRVARLLGDQAENRGFMPYMGTFHGICVRLLRQDGEHLGIPRNFVIYDEMDRRAAVRQVIKQLSIDEKSFPAPLVASLISGAKNEMLTPEDYASLANGPAQDTAARVFPLYEKILKEASALDFDDLINRTVELLETYGVIREKWSTQFRYVMIDEYQDTNLAQYKLVKLLTNQQHNIAVVGDDWQCLVEGSLVETKEGFRKIEDINKGELVKSAGGYSRTSYFKVTSKKEFRYHGEVIQIKTSTHKVLTCTPNHLLFARWDKTEAYFVYLMFSRDKGYRIGTAKGTRFDGKKHDIGLRVRANQERADRMWIIKVCKDHGEAIYFEHLFAYKYGIPMLVFHAFSNRYMRFSQKYIDAIYAEIDTTERAKKLMMDLGIVFEYPHFLPQATVRNDIKRINLNIILFGDKRATIRSPWSMSRILVNTTNYQDLQVFKRLGNAVRAGRAGTFRSEIGKLDYGEIEELAEIIEKEATSELQVNRYSFLTDKKFLFMPASQIYPDMLMPSVIGDQIVEDLITDVSRKAYSGSVYDLDIENVHNYVASGIAVHNSIYSWRGADFRNILGFEKDYKDCTVIKLEQNYRSTKHILDAAHSVITKNTIRSNKKLWTEAGDGFPVQVVQAANERAEAELIIRRIRLGVDGGFRRYHDYAVLYRTNAQSRPIEDVFIRYGIPYRIIGGVRFYDRKEIKDILAYLRLVLQPEDRVSFERVVNVPARGIGAKSLANFYAWRSSQGYTLAEALAEVATCDNLTAKALAGLDELGAILSATRSIVEITPVAGLIESLLRRLDYLNYLNDGTPLGEARQENVRELLSVAQEYQDVGLEGFLEEVALVSDVDTADFGSDAVMLMTLHAAKGLEFPVVFMTGMEETVFPHSRALYDQSEMEEERRLCYVGMTRAKQELYMIFATSRLLYGGVQHNLPSRFLGDIDRGFQTANSSQDYFDLDATPASHPMVDMGLTDASLPELRYLPEVNEGDEVRHKVFGLGTIVSVNGELVTVHFKGKGTKTLNLGFAPLEKV